MSDTRRAFFAFLLIGIVLILTPKYIKLISGGPAPIPVTNDSTIVDLESSRPPVVQQPQRPNEPRLGATTRPQVIPELIAETVYEVTTPLYAAKVSSRAGGSFNEFELFEYKDGRSDGNVQLINDNLSDVNLRITYVNLDGDTVRLVDNFKLVNPPSSKFVNLEDGSTTFTYRYEFPSGAAVEKRLTFQADGYAIPVKIRWENPNLEIGLNTFEIAWVNGIQPTERLLKEDETYGKVYVYQGGVLENEGAINEAGLARQTFSGNTDWVAIRNKYFTVAMIANPTQPGAYGGMAGHANNIIDGTNGIALSSRYEMAIGYPSNQNVDMTLYLGPLSYSRIKALDVDLDRIMNFGFALIRPISKFVLWSLVSLHNFIPNYGIVLILFAVFIRIITNPLTKKSFVSTQKMQLVMPKVKQLQEKYKGNQQKISQETMKLYKSEGVNPLGGCLPILIQMPLLMALFMVFRSTIELRGAPFILWMQDLSTPDVVFTLPFSLPLYGDGVTVLALLMGITMFVQQKVSGAATNPQMKPMLYMMPVMMFFLFNTFPSGLNLYYAFSNILSIFQQRNIRKSLGMDTKPAVTLKKV